MAYKVQFSKKSGKQLDKIPEQERTRIIRRAEELEKEPRPFTCKKLKGKHGYYRIRVGSYRLVYKIKDHICVVSVIAVGNRKEVYAQLGI